MQVYRSLDAFRPVYLADPVDRSHQLNIGRLAWWLVIPGLDGGSTWYDLIGQNHGTLVSASWGATVRPGGSGQLSFSGGPGSPSQVRAPGLALPGAFTLACSASFGSTSLKGMLLKVGFSTTGVGISVGLGDGDTAGNNLLCLFEQVAWHDSGTAIGTGWHRLAVTWDGATIAFFIDGRQVATATGLDAPHPPTEGVTTIGGYDPSPARYFDGPMDDVSVWNRPLSAAEAFADYDLSRRGYPGVLNRY